MQIAIFVDAGYLHAQGSALIAGSKKPRISIRLDVPKVLDALENLASGCAPGSRHLRTYWYDGIVRSGRLTSEQEQIAGASHCKLRLGVVNSRGEQKGVDSLLVTDLIDLARNRAITDALILSGDEDIRIGVQIAQTFGSKVHLLGIKPSRGSQSPDLIQESDTHHEWSEPEINGFMSIVEVPSFAEQPAAKDVVQGPSDRSPQALDKAVSTAIDDTLDSLDQKAIDSALGAFKVNPNSIPQELDRPTLGRIRGLLGRDLTDDERREYRTAFKKQLQEMLHEG